MPELPEVEVLVRHLGPALRGRRIKAVEVRRSRVIEPDSPADLAERLTGARFREVRRQGKFLLFDLRPVHSRLGFTLLGHLGMTGRMYVQPARAALPKHAAVVLRLDRGQFVFEDTRYFGRLTLDLSSVAALGPEALGAEFTPDQFAADLKRSAQPIKVKLLDQSLVAGVGNIYASEALFRAGISPKRRANRLTRNQIVRLHATLREVLGEAIRYGSTLPLDWSGRRKGDGLFYYGSADGAVGYDERLRVYDHAGEACPKCATPIRRIVQATRSTFYCPQCQRG